MVIIEIPKWTRYLLINKSAQVYSAHKLNTSVYKIIIDVMNTVYNITAQ